VTEISVTPEVSAQPKLGWAALGAGYCRSEILTALFAGLAFLVQFRHTPLLKGVDDVVHGQPLGMAVCGN